MIEAGKVYYGPYNSRLFVMSINGDQTVVRKGYSSKEITMPLSEVEDWATKSVLRVYYPDNGEEGRVKMATGIAQDIGIVSLPEGTDPATVWVRYHLVNKPWTFIDIPETEWLAWRNALPS